MGCSTPQNPHVLHVLSYMSHKPHRTPRDVYSRLTNYLCASMCCPTLVTPCTPMDCTAVSQSPHVLHVLSYMSHEMHRTPRDCDLSSNVSFPRLPIERLVSRLANLASHEQSGLGNFQAVPHCSLSGRFYIADVLTAHVLCCR
jgi:hypothetical protein